MLTVAAYIIFAFVCLVGLIYIFLRKAFNNIHSINKDIDNYAEYHNAISGSEYEGHLNPSIGSLAMSSSASSVASWTATWSDNVSSSVASGSVWVQPNTSHISVYTYDDLVRPDTGQYGGRWAPVQPIGDDLKQRLRAEILEEIKHEQEAKLKAERSIKPVDQERKTRKIDTILKKAENG